MLSDCTLESLQILHNFFVILSPEVLEQTLNNLTATEVLDEAQVPVIF